MKKLEEMHIADIIEVTNLYVTPQSLYEIWKEPEEISDIPESIRGQQQLKKNPEFAEELVQDDIKIYTFLLKHGREIDKLKFVMSILRNYKQRLEMSEKIKISDEEKEQIEKGIQGIRRLIKGIDRTIIRYELDSTGKRITHLTIINTKEEVEGIERKDRNSNRERLKGLEEEIEFPVLTYGLFSSDIEYSIAFDRTIGSDLRYMVEYNTIRKVYGDDWEKLDKTRPVYEIASEIARKEFVAEMAITIERHIEEINMDKLLLCSAYRYIEGIEQGDIKKEATEGIKTVLEIIRKHIKKNVKVIIYPEEIVYTLRNLEQDLKKFVGHENNVTYLGKEDIRQLKQGLLEGEITLTSLGTQKVEAIALEPSERTQVLQNNPNNYIFFLREEKCPYCKNVILNDIRNAKKCSQRLLQLLCEKTDITVEEIRDLFDREIISVADLKVVRQQTGTIISDEIIFEKYKQYKANAEQEERARFERYTLAYKNTEILGKTLQEIQDKGENFIAELGEELDPEDLIQLYGVDIIPLKVAVDWGGENIIEELIESGRLKPADAKYLRDEGLLNEQVLKRIFEKCKKMAYSDQVSLVSAVFDGQAKEEQEIRERLAQYYNIEAGIGKSKSKSSTDEGTKRRNGENEESKAKVKMRDPGAKYNFLAQLDKEVTVESGIIDGHIIFHYPYIDGGIVLIEKLHKIKTNTENGVLEIKADNKAATYVLSEEEFIKMRTELIQGGKVNRLELTQRWWKTRDPEHWIPHNGTEYWEKAIMQRFNINEENSRYTSEDIKRINELAAKSVESKKMESR